MNYHGDKLYIKWTLNYLFDNECPVSQGTRILNTFESKEILENFKQWLFFWESYNPSMQTLSNNIDYESQLLLYRKQYCELRILSYLETLKELELYDEFWRKYLHEWFLIQVKPFQINRNIPKECIVKYINDEYENYTNNI